MAGLPPMLPRDPTEEHRAATPLELFFDLVFVIAVSQAAAQLHHALSEGHVLDGITSYAMVFFAVWWAWMNFTWFATSFDTDDWLFRVLTIVQMAGVLVVAAGIESAFVDEDLTVVVGGYVLMRVVMVAQWWRASLQSPEHRRTTRTYAAGIGALQVLWVAMLFLPDSIIQVAGAVLICAEIAVPIVAERKGNTPWHPHHVTERYGCFTLILLGESLLASANTIIGAHNAHQELLPLITLGTAALVVTAALWWIYFWPPHHDAIGGMRQSFTYGYVHYLVFAAAGAFSAGVSVQTDLLADHSELSDVAASFTISIPVAVFVLCVWWIAIRRHGDRAVNTAVPLGALLVLFDPLIPMPATLVAVVCVLIVVVLVRHPPLDRTDTAAHMGT